MTEFTKGKWVYDEPFGVIFSHETCEVIAHVQGAGTGSCFCSTQEGQANARLIAAAPDMYELLKVWVQVQAQPTLRNAQDKAQKLLARIHSDNMKGGE